MKKIIDIHFLGTLQFCQKYAKGRLNIPDQMAAFIISMFLTFNLMIVVIAANIDLHVVIFQIFFGLMMLIMYLTYLRHDRYNDIEIKISLNAKVLVTAYYILSLLLPVMLFHK